MVGTCYTSFTGETYADVTASTAIGYADNALALDGRSLIANTNDPAHGSDTKVLQEYNELNNVTVPKFLPVSQDGLWDFALKDYTAPDDTSYCFRLVKSTSALLDTYSYIPQITTIASPTGPTLDQQMRGGQSVIEGVKQPIVW